MDILDRINLLLGDRDQNELTRYLNIGNQAYTDWKSGKSKSYRKYLIEIAEFFHVSTDYLAYGQESDSNLTEDEQKLINYFRKLPEKVQQQLIGRAELLAEQASQQNVINITNVRYIKIAKVAAGAGVSVPFTSDNDFEIREFPSDTVPYDADCGVPINGNSMEPDYPHESIVWIKRTKDIQDGDIIVCTLNGEPYCKIYKLDGLYSINEKNYNPIIVTENDTFKTFGKVIGCYKNN